MEQGAWGKEPGEGVKGNIFLLLDKVGHQPAGGQGVVCQDGITLHRQAEMQITKPPELTTGGRN